MNIILNMLEFNDQDKKEILEIATKLKQRKGMKKSLLQKWLQWPIPLPLCLELVFLLNLFLFNSHCN